MALVFFDEPQVWTHQSPVGLLRGWVSLRFKETGDGHVIYFTVGIGPLLSQPLHALCQIDVDLVASMRLGDFNEFLQQATSRALAGRQQGHSYVANVEGFAVFAQSVVTQKASYVVAILSDYDATAALIDRSACDKGTDVLAPLFKR